MTSVSKCVMSCNLDEVFINIFSASTTTIVNMFWMTRSDGIRRWISSTCSVTNSTNVLLFTVIVYNIYITAPAETVEPTRKVNVKWGWTTLGYTYAICFGRPMIIILI